MNDKEIGSNRASEEALFSQENIKELSRFLDWPGRGTTKEDLVLINKAGVQTGWQVLDVGSGTGYLSIPLAMQVKPQGVVYCVDSEPLLQEVIKEKAKKMKLEHCIKLVQTDVLAMPFSDSYFDSVFSVYMLHELGDLASKALREMRRVLKPNHKLVIADFRYIENDQRSVELENWFSQLSGQNWWHKFKGKSEEVHFRFSLRDLEVMLQDTGFHSIKVSPWLEFQMHGEAIK